MQTFLNYLKNTKGELKHVNWPTRKDTINFTLVVIVVSLLVGAYLGLFDFIFNLILKSLII